MNSPRRNFDVCATILLVAGLVVAGCTPAKKAAPEGSGDEPVIRVLIGETGGSVKITATGAFRIESDAGMALVRSDDPAAISVRRDGTSTQIHLEPQGSAAVAEGDVYITPTGNAGLEYDGVAWPGRMLVQGVDDSPSGSGLRVVNVVGLESYLEGVLPHEIGNPGPDAFSAMEAQAVTARTYAMSRIADRKGAPFDVYSGVRDQVYKGRDKTSQLASSAVRETRGRILVLKGELARTYYSATCGGHTSDIRLMWPQREPARYLQGVFDRDDAGTFCTWVHNFRWRFSYSGKELGDLLRRTIPAETGVDPERVGHLVDIGVSARGPSGRARYLEVVTTQGSFTIEGDRIRWVLMPDPEAGRILPSTLFNLHKEMNNQRVASVSIVGGGNGHGVGMCQNGAIGMAKRGYTRDMILAHYYPGTEISKRY